MQTKAGRSRTSVRVWRLVQSPPVRLIIAPLFVGGAVAVVARVLGAVQEALSANTDRASPLQFLFALVLAATALGAYYTYVRLVERRPVTELSRPGAVRETASGVLLGVGLLTLTVAVLALLGVYRVTGLGTWVGVLTVLVKSIDAGIVEEILFRGIFFRIVEEGLGSWIALSLSALFFGFAHLGNPDANLLSASAIALEAGILLAAVYMLTRRLWLAIGLHIAWNFTQGGIFGIAISGFASDGLLRGEMRGPELLSGGTFGAEASVVAMVICLTAGVLLVLRARQKGRIVEPFWRRGRSETSRTKPTFRS